MTGRSFLRSHKPGPSLRVYNGLSDYPTPDESMNLQPQTQGLLVYHLDVCVPSLPCSPSLAQPFRFQLRRHVDP